MPATHFVGFSVSSRYHAAVRVFGEPDFIHRFWDSRAQAEVMPEDRVIFAKGTEQDPPRPQAYDDSAYF